MYSVVVDNVNKVYETTFRKRRVQALNDFSVKVEKGSIFGLLGPNGAGKTTLVKILLGITFPTNGKATVLGQDISNYKLKSKVGYLPENHKFPPFLNGGDVIKYAATLSGYEPDNLDAKIDELLSLVKMLEWKKMKVKKYSKGMMQRLGLAQAMINDPDLIILDEPTDGVDPIGRKEIRDVLIDLKNKGKTVFLNSHLLSEVELITDNVAILNKGNLIHQGDVQELTTSKEKYRVKFEAELKDELLTNELKRYTLENKENNAAVFRLNDTAELNNLIDDLRKAQLLITSIEPVKSSLEDMFISLIKNSDKN
ncbi:MAG: ABC transporter ATP-binding protein [Ignavibacteria bacterium]|jgi:ABC-2 type transport system ATP-binding protein